MSKGKRGFVKGQSGNPKGRPPKQRCIPDILRKIGAETINTKDGTMPKMEALMRMVFKSAVEGNSWAVNFIADRTEGKPVQKLIEHVETKVNTDALNLDLRTRRNLLRAVEAQGTEIIDGDWA